MATRVTFYDIAPDDRLALAVKLARAAWDKEKRLLIRCHPHELAHLDDHLWTFREESFLPHEAVTDGPLLDEEARVVLVGRDQRPLAAEILLQLAPCELAFAQGFEAVIDIVDHSDPTHLAASRARYKAWSDLGLRPELKKTV